MKKCTKCSKYKNNCEYYARYGYCKECARKQAKKYKIRNRKACLARDKEYYHKNKHKYYENPEYHRAKSRKWRKNNKEIANEKTKIWREKNKEHISKYNKLDYVVNKKRVRNKTHTLLKQGKIKLTNCVMCNRNDSIEMHHEDYNIPNKIICLCKDCHSKIHRKKNSQEFTRMDLKDGRRIYINQKNINCFEVFSE